jgi:hypothetical protein
VLSKADIRFQKADNRMRKISYKGLTPDQVKYIKALERFRQLDKELSEFWITCKRDKNRAADFQNMTEEELNLFDMIYNGHEKARKKMEKCAEKIDVEKTESIFMQLNTHSYSF